MTAWGDGSGFLKVGDVKKSKGEELVINGWDAGSPKGGVIGGKSSIPQVAGKIPLIVLALWGVICYLPPFRGTRNNH